MKAKEAIKIIGDWISEETHKRKYNKTEITKLSEALIYLKGRAEQQDSWIPVSEKLPKNEKRVLICAERKLYNGKVIQIITTAMHEDGTLRTADSDFTWEDCDFEYCEKADSYIIPKGWYEQNRYCEVFGVVDDFVLAWQPLPEPWKGDKDIEN